MDQAWSINHPPRFVKRAWDGEAVIYDTFNGNTYYLEPLAFQLVVDLEISVTLSLNQLIQKLNEAFLFPPEEDVTALIESTLAKLQGIGLIATTS